MFLTILALLIVTFIIYSIYKPYFLAEKFEKKGFYKVFNPLLGLYYEAKRSFRLHKDSAYQLKAVARANKDYRGIISNFGSRSHIMLIDPALMKEFSGKQDLYTKPEEFYGIFQEFSSEGIVFLNNKRWRTHRKLVSMAFHYEILKSMIHDIATITQELFDKLKKGNINKINIMNEFQAITGETVGRLFFGEKFGEYQIRGKRLTEILNDLMVSCAMVTRSPFFLLFGKKFTKLRLLKAHKELYDRMDEFRTFSLELIARKAKEDSENPNRSTKKNLMEIFFEQRRTNPEECFTDDEILAEFITFFTAGMDTTGHLITNATYFFSAHPQFREKIMAEVNEFCPSVEEADIEKLNKMEFMTAFFKECLRLMPPGPYLFERKALVDHKIGDISIKKNDLVNISIISNNYNSKYHEEPEIFNPERWTDPNSKTFKSVSEEGSLFVPFSMGNRNCIGQHMAMNEAKVVFSLFLKNFEYEMSDKNFNPSNLILRFLYEFEQDVNIDMKAKF